MTIFQALRAAFPNKRIRRPGGEWMSVSSVLSSYMSGLLSGGPQQNQYFKASDWEVEA